MARGRQHGFGCFAVQPAAGHLSPQLARGLAGAERVPVRPRLGHRVVDVRRGQQPVRRRQRGRGQPPRIARAIEALVVPGGDLAAAAERVHPGQHPVGQVGVQPDPLGLGLGEGAGLVPDRVGHPEPAQVMDQPRAAQDRHVVVGVTGYPRRRAGQVRHPARVAGQKGLFMSTRSAIASRTSSRRRH